MSKNENRKEKLIIFDWAGTTVDYGCFAPVGAFALAFQRFGLTPTTDEIREPMGMLKRDHIRTMLAMPRLKDQWNAQYGSDPDEESVEKIYSVFEESLMNSLRNYADPKPGVIETVAWLREHGFRIGSTTGYTDTMMQVVAPCAAEKGYAPDAWFSPDAVGGTGRPYPYMIYANMQHFQIESVSQVIKIGDTVADIREGKNAGVLSLGVLEGSSVIGLSEAEYQALSSEEKAQRLEEARSRLLLAGADDVLTSISDLPAWLEKK